MSISLTKRNFLYQITLLTLIAGWVGAGIYIIYYLDIILEDILSFRYISSCSGFLKYLCLMLAVSMPRKRCCCFTWR